MTEYNIYYSPSKKRLYYKGYKPKDGVYLGAYGDLLDVMEILLHYDWEDYHDYSILNGLTEALLNQFPELWI